MKDELRRALRDGFTYAFRDWWWLLTFAPRYLAKILLRKP